MQERSRTGAGTRVLIVLVAALAAGCTADSSLSGYGGVAASDQRGRTNVFFSERDRALVRAYYRETLPPGLAKRDQLPPGLKKQLVRRGSLPPGLQTQRLPGELERRLSPLPDGYVRLRVATDVLLFDERSRVILDVIADIGR